MFGTLLALSACSPLLPPPGRMGAPAPWTAAEAGWSGEVGLSTGITAGGGEVATPVVGEGSATWSTGGPLTVNVSGTVGTNWGGLRPAVGLRRTGASGLLAGLALTAAGGTGDAMGLRPWKYPYLGVGLTGQLGWTWPRGHTLALSLGLEGALHVAGFATLRTGEAVELEPDLWALPWLWPSAHLRLDLPLRGGRHAVWGGVGFPGLVAAGMAF